MGLSTAFQNLLMHGAAAVGGSTPKSVQFPNKLGVNAGGEGLIEDYRSFTLEVDFFCNALENPPGGYAYSDQSQWLFLGSTATVGYTLRIIYAATSATAGKMYMASYQSGQIGTAQVIPVQQWNHFCFTYDAQLQEGVIYVNNVEQARGAIMLRGVGGTAMGYIDSAQGYNAVNGRMDNLRFWGYVRTPGQRAAAWNAPNALLPDLLTSRGAFDFQEDYTGYTINQQFAGYTDAGSRGLLLTTGSTSYENVQVEGAPKSSAPVAYPAFSDAAYAGAVATAGQYGCYNAPSCIKAGNWFEYTTGGVPSGVTGMINNDPSTGAGWNPATFDIHFEGTGIRLYGVRNGAYGKAVASIDANYTNNVVSYARPGDGALELVCEIAGLPYGRHVFRHACYNYDHADRPSVPQYFEIF